MGELMSVVIDKVVHISEDRASRLRDLAGSRQTSEDAIVEQALDILFDLSNPLNRDDERSAWSSLSTPALVRIWDNESDAAYDNWRELYGLSQG